MYVCYKIELGVKLSWHGKDSNAGVQITGTVLDDEFRNSSVKEYMQGQARLLVKNWHWLKAG